MDVGRFARFLANDIKDPDDDKRKIDNDLKLEKFTFFVAVIARVENSEAAWRINKKAIIFNRNLCFFPRFIIAGDFYVVDKFSFSIVRTFLLLFEYRAEVREAHKAISFHLAFNSPLKLLWLLGGYPLDILILLLIIDSLVDIAFD